MPTPELPFEFRMSKEQPSRRVPFEHFNSIRQATLWLTGYQQMDMVRHDLHSIDGHFKVFCRSKQMGFKLLVQAIYKNLLTVFRTPNDMILQRVNISTTMRNIGIQLSFK